MTDSEPIPEDIRRLMLDEREIAYVGPCRQVGCGILLACFRPDCPAPERKAERERLAAFHADLAQMDTEPGVLPPLREYYARLCREDRGENPYKEAVRAKIVEIEAIATQPRVLLLPKEG